MTDDLKQKIVQMFRHVDAADWPALTQYFHADVEYRRPGYAAIRGLPDLLDFYECRRIIKTGEHRLESMFHDDGGHALSVTGSFRGADREGRPLDVRFCDVYVFEDEKIIRRETFFSAPAV